MKHFRQQSLQQSLYRSTLTAWKKRQPTCYLREWFSSWRNFYCIKNSLPKHLTPLIKISCSQFNKKKSCDPPKNTSAHSNVERFRRDAVQVSDQRMGEGVGCLRLGGKEPEDDSSNGWDLHQLPDHLRTRGSTMTEEWDGNERASAYFLVWDFVDCKTAVDEGGTMNLIFWGVCGRALCVFVWCYTSPLLQDRYITFLQATNIFIGISNTPGTISVL